jgi:predicted nuclease of predicted toxin-antitoxin system
VKYYLDEDISPKIADILTGYQIDTKSSHEVGMNQSIDIEQLELAASQG